MADLGTGYAQARIKENFTKQDQEYEQNKADQKMAYELMFSMKDVNTADAVAKKYITQKDADDINNFRNLLAESMEDKAISPKEAKEILLTYGRISGHAKTIVRGEEKQDFADKSELQMNLLNTKEDAADERLRTRLDSEMEQLGKTLASRAARDQNTFNRREMTGLLAEFRAENADIQNEYKTAMTALDSQLLMPEERRKEQARIAQRKDSRMAAVLSRFREQSSARMGGMFEGYGPSIGSGSGPMIGQQLAPGEVKVVGGSAAKPVTATEIK